MKVDFTDKVSRAFSTGSGRVSGKEFVVMSLVMFMLSNRMVVAGPLYRNDKTDSVWGEVGAAAMTGPLDPGVSEGELAGRACGPAGRQAKRSWNAGPRAEVAIDPSPA
jgi:multimeric flavodoxin WrbA